MQPGTVPASPNLNPPPGTASTGKPSKRRFRRWMAGLALLLVVLVAHPFLLAWAGQWLDVGEQLKSPVDCVLILGGGADTRPFLAAAVYRAGFANKVLICEAVPIPPGVEGAGPNEDQVQRQVLLARGVPAESIEQLASPVDSTRDEALSLGRYLASHPKSSVAIVTSDFHTRRARLIFCRVLPNVRDQLHVISCPMDDFGPRNWWHYKDGVLLYTSEYAKLARDFVWLRAER